MKNIFIVYYLNKNIFYSNVFLFKQSCCNFPTPVQQNYCKFVLIIRTVLIPEQQNISIHLPMQFIGKKVEVIAFSIEEADIEKGVEKIQTHFASEQVLAKDWLTTEEDEAWKDL